MSCDFKAVEAFNEPTTARQITGEMAYDIAMNFAIAIFSSSSVPLTSAKAGKARPHLAARFALLHFHEARAEFCTNSNKLQSRKEITNVFERRRQPCLEYPTMTRGVEKCPLKYRGQAEYGTDCSSNERCREEALYDRKTILKPEGQSRVMLMTSLGDAIDKIVTMVGDLVRNLVVDLLFHVPVVIVIVFWTLLVVEKFRSNREGERIAHYRGKEKVRRCSSDCV
ncbi:hypothetical protein M7I_5588 [Glarea lozoyensis 74030]|uniref:Uncharacterized protein n=1 Tax=Glarea lozoyensis (strain ATCC 74030 / MF5533) TaxID=1104152 RepID=H0ESB0_GLAL7|nr:hypothetical protein M7I_5588 [Glarea lozoyensis 74030]